MQKKYTSLGLMSGTSGDGVDASIINSNGINKFEVIKNKYFEYDPKIYKSIHSLKERIFNLDDLKKFSRELNDLERKITLFHAAIIKDFEINDENMLVGFHGQTIYHNSKEKLSKQLGDGKLLNQLTNKRIIFNFRKNDILNGGEGAPLTPIFHQLLVTQKKIKLPVCVLNIGGISNITIIKKYIGSMELSSKDIGPGNCLIDRWVRNNSNQKFDIDGKLAKIGKKNEIIFEQAQELFANRKNKDKLSFDVNDFDVSFCRGLSLEDGVTTLTNFTASILGDSLSSILDSEKDIKEILLCGGGRKNQVLTDEILKFLPEKVIITKIDKYGVEGDYVESQAFAFLAIRSYMGFPISFPGTTQCKHPCIGGEIIEN